MIELVTALMNVNHHRNDQSIICMLLTSLQFGLIHDHSFLLSNLRIAHLSSRTTANPQYGTQSKRRNHSLKRPSCPSSLQRPYAIASSFLHHSPEITVEGWEPSSSPRRGSQQSSTSRGRMGEV